MSYTISKPLTKEYFDYDMTDGFRMGVEKEWHKIKPLSPLRTSKGMNDLNGNKLDTTSYGISIFVKAVVPLSNFSDSNVTENDFTYNNKYTFKNATNLGVPVNLDGEYTDSYDRLSQLDMIKSGLPSAYALPENINTTGLANSSFAEGKSNVKFKQNFDINGNRYGIYLNNNASNYLCIGSNSDKSMCCEANILNNTLTYIIDTANINLGFTNNSVIPELFTVFGQAGHLDGTQPKLPCWFLVCLGVDTVG